MTRTLLAPVPCPLTTERSCSGLSANQGQIPSLQQQVSHHDARGPVFYIFSGRMTIQHDDSIPDTQIHGRCNPSEMQSRYTGDATLLRCNPDKQISLSTITTWLLQSPFFARVVLYEPFLRSRIFRSLLQVCVHHDCYSIFGPSHGDDATPNLLLLGAHHLR